MILLEEAILTLCVISGVVLIIVILADFLGSFLCFLMVVLSELSMLRLAGYWGLYLNSLTVLLFVICVGISVDYSVHIIYAFKN